MDVREVLEPDAIQSIDDPAFGPTTLCDPDDQVIVVEGSTARAYPIRILHSHEIVNDELDGLQIVVTWCPLCGSAVVYERRVEGRELTFGVSGKLADDDLVMYDRETGSEWKQSTGEAIAGPLAGTSLSIRPGPLMAYGTFRDQYPEGVILQPPDESADYDSTFYETYVAGEGFGLAARRGDGTGEREWGRSDLEPKDRVLGIELDGDALGFPRSRVADVATATVGDVAVVVVASGVRLFAYEDPGFELRAAGSAGTVRGDGTRWDVSTGRGGDGRRLVRIPARRLFAFAWQDDHGPNAFYEC